MVGVMVGIGCGSDELDRCGDVGCGDVGCGRNSVW